MGVRDERRGAPGPGTGRGFYVPVGPFYPTGKAFYSLVLSFYVPVGPFYPIGKAFYSLVLSFYVLVGAFY